MASDAKSGNTFFDERLFGAHSGHHMVAVEHLPGIPKDTVRLFFREGNTVRSEAEAFEPFIVAAADAAAGCPVSHRSETLRGVGKLDRLLLFGSMSDCDAARSWLTKKTGRTPTAPDSPYLYLADPVLQHLLRTGRTHFLGMQLDDVRRMQIDIECLTSEGYDFCNAEREHDRIVAVAMADNTGWTEVLRGDEHDEAELLRGMIRLIQERDPDVIEGHNIFNFDLPYIEERCKRHAIALELGRDGSLPLRRSSRFSSGERVLSYERYTVMGRHIVDTLFMAQLYDVSHRDLSGYGLKDVARHFGVAAEDRTYVDGGDISALFFSDPARLMDYARDDVIETRAVAAILCPSSFIQAQMLPFSYQNVCVRGSATKIDMLLVREYLRQSHALPRAMPAQHFAGGYTDMFVEGVIRHVHHCDVRSLYPSLMLSRKIGSSRDELGVFLALLDSLRDFRFSAKQHMKDAATRSEHDYFEALQATFKILINSFYGYLGFAQGRFNDFAAAAEVTLQGRELLKQMIGKLRELGATPIEIDTDGIYYVPPDNIVHCQDDGASAQFEADFSSFLPAGIEVEFDGRYEAMLSYKMKNYALLRPDGEIIIKGAALRSRGVEPFLRDCLEQIIECRLKGEDKRLPAIRRTFETAIKSHKLPMSKLSRTERLQESLAAYRTKRLSGKRAKSAVYELVMDAERDYRMGDQVAFYVTGDKKNAAVHEHAVLLSAWDGVTRDENVPYYLGKLAAVFKKFAPETQAQLELF